MTAPLISVPPRRHLVERDDTRDPPVNHGPAPSRPGPAPCPQRTSVIKIKQPIKKLNKAPFYFNAIRLLKDETFCLNVAYCNQGRNYNILYIKYYILYDI